MALTGSLCDTFYTSATSFWLVGMDRHAEGRPPCRLVGTASGRYRTCRRDRRRNSFAVVSRASFDCVGRCCRSSNMQHTDRHDATFPRGVTQ